MGLDIRIPIGVMFSIMGALEHPDSQLSRAILAQM